MIAIFISSALLLIIALAFWARAISQIKKAESMFETARRVIRKAESIPQIYLQVIPMDIEAAGPIEKLAEAAANDHLRALLVRLREDAIKIMEGNPSADIGNRIFGRIEAYSSVQTMLDQFARQHSEMILKKDMS